MAVSSKQDRVPGPVQISFDITTNCNFRCIHCFNNSGADAPSQESSPEEKLETARQIARMHPINVCLCGGEATTSPHLFEIIDALRPGVGKISMVSNGFLMTPALAQKLREHGLSLVQISLDGAYAWQHDTFRGVQGSFERAVAAIRYLRAAGMPAIDTSLVPNRLNYETMDRYAELCADIGVSQIRVMPFLPSGRGLHTGRRLMLDAEQSFEFQRSLARISHKMKGSLTVQWGDPLDHMRRNPINAKFGLRTYMMEIAADGSLPLTPYLPISAGNLRGGALEEYWAAGCDRMWGDPRFTRYTDQIHNIYDLETFEPQPYSGETITIDLLEKKQS